MEKIELSQAISFFYMAAGFLCFAISTYIIKLIIG